MPQHGFVKDGVRYMIDTDPDSFVLQRMNAMTFYESVYDWLTVARIMGSDLKSSDPVYYCVKCVGRKWVKVSVDFAKDHFQV